MGWTELWSRWVYQHLLSKRPPDGVLFLGFANILNELPKRLQGRAKAALQAIWMADTREAA